LGFVLLQNIKYLLFYTVLSTGNLSPLCNVAIIGGGRALLLLTQLIYHHMSAKCININRMFSVKVITEDFVAISDTVVRTEVGFWLCTERYQEV